MHPGIVPVLTGGERFGPWQIIDVTDGAGPSNSTWPVAQYEPGDFVYIAVLMRTSSTGSPPDYPILPTISGFTQYGAAQTSWSATPSLRRTRIGDYGRIMTSGDTISSVTLGTGISRFISVTLRNSIELVAGYSGDISYDNPLAFSPTPTDKTLLVSTSLDSETTNVPTFSPDGTIICDESNRRMRLLDSSTTGVVSVELNARSGKIIRQIDFT